MDNDKLAWFGGGVVVGLLIGLGVAVGFSYQKLQEVQAEALMQREEAEMQAERAAAAEARFRMAAETALREAERARVELLKATTDMKVKDR